MLKSKCETTLAKVFDFAQFVVPHAKVVFESLVCVGKSALIFTGKRIFKQHELHELHMSSETWYGALDETFDMRMLRSEKVDVWLQI